jgi:hypothetical protein
MLRVCERCDAWIEEIVVSDDGAAVCPHCGYRRPFLRLPLFQVTGASGAGKTRVCRNLPAALPECVVLDQDILLTGLPWEQHRRNWLRLAVNVHQGGRSVVFVGTQLREHYEQLPERAWFDEVHYVSLVCDDEELAARLRARPSRRDTTDETIAEMQQFNRWLKASAAATSPQLTLSTPPPANRQRPSPRSRTGCASDSIDLPSRCQAPTVARANCTDRLASGIPPLPSSMQPRTARRKACAQLVPLLTVPGTVRGAPEQAPA